MKNKHINMIQELLDYARKNDLFNLTSRETGEFEAEVIDALDKAIERDALPFYDGFGCPTCSQYVHLDYCGNCGQKVEFPDE